MGKYTGGSVTALWTLTTTNLLLVQKVKISCIHQKISELTMNVKPL